jgi:hypothetical protein
MEIEKAEGRSKVTRTVRLNVDVDAKLIRLTELLGTTINAYLNVELGKAINRDYLQFQVADRQGAAMDNFMQTALLAMQTQMEKDGEDA